MRNVTQDNLTETFLGYFSDDTDPRLREIMTSLATHLHSFAKETNLTHKEWTKGLDILRSAGAITTPERDEYPDPWSTLCGSGWFPCLLYTSPSPRD